jgi:antitoxin component YwqK of YwqJK toxin-antitoxin module
MSSKWLIYKHTIIIMLILMSGCSSKRIVKEVWPDGSTQLEEKMKKSGNKVVYSYYKNGQKEYKATYFNSMLDGETISWDENGDVKSISYYLAGELHGKWTQFNTLGIVVHESEYFHGDKHGYEKYFWDNGNIKSQQEYIFGIVSGEIFRWDVSGERLN